MARAKEVLLKELLDLDPPERAKVAEDALRSLENTDYGQLSPDWEEEIQRRLRAVEGCSAKLIPGDEVFKETDAELRSRRGGG